MKQVDKEAYDFYKYSYKGRWVSYFYQLREILRYKPKSILEIGVGDSVFSNYIKTTTNIEYKSVDVAEDLKPDIVASVEALPLPDKSFDVVCAFEVLEHLPFEKFEVCLKEMKRVARKAVVISLPHFGPEFTFSLKIPFISRIGFSYKIPVPKKHIWAGQHYWEIGKRGYSLGKIKKALRSHFTIAKEFVPFENQYHHFFVLETKKDRTSFAYHVKKYVKEIIFFLAYYLYPEEKREAGIILAYHSIGDSKAFFTVKRDAFERQIAFLKDKKFSFLKFSEFSEKVANGQSVANTISIVFDDGYQDNFDNAYPILQKYSLPQSYFISTGFIGSHREICNTEPLKIMDEKTIKTLSQNPLIECMPHGHRHIHLGRATTEEAKNDIIESQKALEKITGKKGLYFVFPYGSYTAETIQILRSNGFKAAGTVKENLVTSKSDLFELPRMTVNSGTSFYEFACKVTRPVLYLKIKNSFIK